jgi:parallel beta-helix repeat protein
LQEHGRRVLRLLLVVSVLALAAGPAARAGDVVVLSTIQAAVDLAQPGDRVIVPPGRYHESVTISRSGITIRGSHGAVLDASGFSTGIRAASGPGGLVCPPLTLHDLAVEGLRIEGASFTGVFFRGVDGFAFRNGSYSGNRLYAVFPVCSRDGVIAGNHVEGTEDGAIYVGNSDDVLIERNHAAASVAGILVENSTDVLVRRNTTIGNTGGIVTFVLPGLPVPVTEDVVVEDNVVMHNNRPNPFAPSLQNPLSFLPTGTGILTIGADRVTVRRNRVVGNDSLGIGVTALPIPNPDPRVDPDPDGVRVVDNVALRNGRAPDPLRLPAPGADLVYDGSGAGTCFAGNVFQTAFPPSLASLFACS